MAKGNMNEPKNENSKKWNMQKVTIVGIAVFVVISIILGVLAVLTGNEVASKKKIKVLDPELARAMTYEEFQEGDENIEGTDNVKFSAFFLRDLDGDGYAEKIKGTCREIGKQDTIYMEVNVLTEGRLKNGKIQINGQNFYMQTALPKDDELKENYIGNNIKTIELNELTNGTQKLLTGVVRSGDYSIEHGLANAIGNNINNYSRNDNKIIFTGTYVGENGEETEIRKEMPLTVDWYGTTKTIINPEHDQKTQTYQDLANRIDEENGLINLTLSVYTQEKNDELILSKSHLEGIIQEFNGYAPVSVKCTNRNVAFNYDEETRKFTIDREATIEDDGIITNTLSRDNKYTLDVVYPLEAYTSIESETIIIITPVEAYYEGYNNEHEEFNNPYRSEVAKATVATVFNYGNGDFVPNIYVGKYIKNPDNDRYRYVVSKEKPLNIYNGKSSEEKEDIYNVRWEVEVGNSELEKIELKEDINSSNQNGDLLIKSDASKESMENLTTNIGIGFSRAALSLKDDGEIKIYDDVTGDLLLTINKTNANDYTSENPYKYELPVKHIRVEINGINANAILCIYNIKELDDSYITENYTLEEFDQLSQIESHVKAYVNGEYSQTKKNIANYESDFSYATIALSENTLSTQVTEKNDIVTITAKEDNTINQVGWVDGNFLIKFPEEIIDLEINNVAIDNENVEIVNYEIETRDNNLFIKLNTKNKTEKPESYQIQIDCNISANPKKETTTKQVELYATNEEGRYYYQKEQDIYDVNGNFNLQEQINKTTTEITVVSPGSIITSEIATNYDEKGSITISPQVADVKAKYIEDEQEYLTADVSVYLKNNYSGEVSDIVLLGNIPFEGNKYVISKNDLGTEFTCKMKNTGIAIPEELQEYTVIYYSDMEEPTQELEDSTNNWKTADQVTDWSTVKTYLITLNNYVMSSGKEFNFDYTIQIPKDINLNKEAFCDHGVYFSLVTEEGKYRTQTEPNKIGFRVAEKYDLELEKYQIGKNKKVGKATYKVTEEGKESGKTAITNVEGKLVINDLYAEKIYVIEELRGPEEYELNPDKIKIVGHVNNENGILTIEKIEGITRNEIEVVKEEGKNYVTNVKVEDEAKASLKIQKIDQGTSAPINKAKFKITGTGLSANGKVLSTNVDGEASLLGLKIGEIYCIEETKADGYYLLDKIYFKVVNNNGIYEVKIVDETGAELENNGNQDVRIELNDEIPTVVIKLKDEVIPIYNLEITKIKQLVSIESTNSSENQNQEQNEDITYLSGAKFRLYKSGTEIGEYETNENGKLIIENLYAYEEDKNTDQTYVLKEIIVPEGYSKVKDIRFKVTKNEDDTYSFEEILEDGQSPRRWTVEENTIKLTVEDNPSFKLIKKDEESDSLLPNVKFAIYNVDNEERPATNSKGEIIGTKETINGKEYYTVKTELNGEISIDLPEGLYKAVELEAEEKYDLSNNTYYFGIGENRKKRKIFTAEWGKSVGGTGSDYIESVTETSDGGYVVVGDFSQTITLDNGETLIPKGSSDGLIIKYKANGEVEWGKSIGGTTGDYIRSVTQTSDGGYVVVGDFMSAAITLDNGEILRNHGSTSYRDGMIIKYNQRGEVIWGKAIGGTNNDYISSIAKTSEGGYVLGGYFNSSQITLDNGEILRTKGNFDGMIIKTNLNGEVEWGKSVGGTGADYINSITQIHGGEYVIGGYFESLRITLENGDTLTRLRKWHKFF